MLEKPTPLGLTPHLTLSDATAAIAFYRAAFGAEEHHIHTAPGSSRVMHAALSIQGSYLMLSDDFPEYRGGISCTPEALGGTTIVLHLHVADADSVFNQAIAAGAESVMPMADQFWGDRYGQVRDPFGYTWSIGQPLKALTADDVQKNMNEMFQSAVPSKPAA